MSIELNDTSALLGARVLADMIDALDPEAQLAITGEDVEELAHLHVSLTRSAQRLSTIKAAVEAALVEVMPYGVVEIPGIPALEKHKGNDGEKWDTEGLVPKVVQRGLDPEGTGEFPADPMVAVDLAVKALTAAAPFTPSMKWRKKALRSLGLDPDEWSSSTPGRWSVQIHEEAAK